MKSFVIALAVLMAQSAVLAGPALAHRGDVTNASLRQEMRTSLVTIEGALSCNTENGASCSLRLQELSTGKSYKLRNASSAMKLYNSGTINVAIEGRFRDSDTIEIVSIR